jgi:hypothetical protein
VALVDGHCLGAKLSIQSLRYIVSGGELVLIRLQRTHGFDIRPQEGSDHYRLAHRRFAKSVFEG